MKLDHGFLGRKGKMFMSTKPQTKRLVQKSPKDDLDNFHELFETVLVSARKAASKIYDKSLRAGTWAIIAA